MSRHQISVFGMICLVMSVGLGIACLTHASSPWAMIPRVAYFVALGTVPLGCIYRRRDRQAYYVGFTLWAWGYLALSSTSVPITVYPLNWGYNTMIPTERQAGPNRSQGRGVDVPVALVEKSQKREGLGEYVDLRAKGALIAEEAHVRVLNELGPTTDGPAVQLVLIVDQATADRIEDAKVQGLQLTVSGHRSGPFAAFMATPPVRREDFTQVGHSIFGLIAGVVGGLLGTYFYASQVILASQEV